MPTIVASASGAFSTRVGYGVGQAARHAEDAPLDRRCPRPTSRSWGLRSISSRSAWFSASIIVIGAVENRLGSPLDIDRLNIRDDVQGRGRGLGIGRRVGSSAAAVDRALMSSRIRAKLLRPRAPSDSTRPTCARSVAPAHLLELFPVRYFAWSSEDDASPCARRALRRAAAASRGASDADERLQRLVHLGELRAVHLDRAHLEPLAIVWNLGAGLDRLRHADRVSVVLARGTAPGAVPRPA
jgi:hypothetical protein